MAVSKVGRAEYQGCARAESVGSDRQRWRITYRAMLAETEIDCQVAEFVCWTLSAGQLVDEAGLSAEAVGDLVVMRGVRTRGTRSGT
jgi:hypothetical protein